MLRSRMALLFRFVVGNELLFDTIAKAWTSKTSGNNPSIFTDKQNLQHPLTVLYVHFLVGSR